jgi:hypothetical protein
VAVVLEAIASRELRSTIETLTRMIDWSANASRSATMQRRKTLQNKLVECNILSVAARSGRIDAARQSIGEVSPQNIE